MESNDRIVHLRMTYRGVRLVAQHRNRPVANDTPPKDLTPLRRAGR